MSEDNYRTQLLNLTALAAEYCNTIENTQEYTRGEFVSKMLILLPKIYVGFLEYSPAQDEEYYLQPHIDEDYYESIRRRLEDIMGSEDVYLETFVEDMKYSDTPIGVSISESLADIFQSLYNFVYSIRESEGENLTEAYCLCHEEFDEFWAQTLCNVMGALNAIRNVTDVE